MVCFREGGRDFVHFGFANLNLSERKNISSAICVAKIQLAKETRAEKGIGGADIKCTNATLLDRVRIQRQNEARGSGSDYLLCH